MPTSQTQNPSQHFQPAVTALDDGDLDFVEVVLDIERDFGIRVPDVEAEHLYTVGQLHQLVCRLAGVPVSGRCLGARAHRDVCKALSQAGFDRSQWRPSARVGRLQEAHQVRQWNEVATTLGFARFNLGRSSEMRREMFTATLLVGLVGMSIFLSFGLTGLGILRWGAMAALIAWILAVLVTIPRATYPPFAATRELTTALLARRFSGYARATWTPQEHALWSKLVPIIARSYGVRPDRIVPSTRIVGDTPLLDPVLKFLGAR